MEVEGEDAYGLLKYESGVHRVQRVPETETQGRVHTSAASVAVLPKAEEFDVEINPADIELQTARSRRCRWAKCKQGGDKSATDTQAVWHCCGLPGCAFPARKPRACNGNASQQSCMNSNINKRVWVTLQHIASHWFQLETEVLRSAPTTIHKVG